MLDSKLQKRLIRQSGFLWEFSYKLLHYLFLYNFFNIRNTKWPILPDLCCEMPSFSFIHHFLLEFSPQFSCFHDNFHSIFFHDKSVADRRYSVYSILIFIKKQSVVLFSLFSIVLFCCRLLFHPVFLMAGSEKRQFIFAIKLLKKYDEKKEHRMKSRFSIFFFMRLFSSEFLWIKKL